MYHQVGTSLWVGLERILDLICWCFAIDQISRIDLPNEVLFQYIVNILLLMDGKNVPIRLYAAASGTENYIAAGMTLTVPFSASITGHRSQTSRRTYMKSVIS